MTKYKFIIYQQQLVIFFSISLTHYILHDYTESNTYTLQILTDNHKTPHYTTLFITIKLYHTLDYTVYINNTIPHQTPHCVCL